MRKWRAATLALGALVLVMSTRAASAQLAPPETTTTVATSQANPPSPDDLANASIEGSYRMSALVTDQQGVTGGNIGETTVLGTPVVFQAAGEMTFFFDNFSYTRTGASLTLSGSAQTDCISPEGTVTTPNGENSTATFPVTITQATFVDGVWQATQLDGTGDYVHTPAEGTSCNPGFQTFEVTLFRLDPPVVGVPDVEVRAGAVSGSAEASTDAELIDGGATASVQLVIDPEQADPFESRSVTATIVVTGSWFTFDAAAPIPGATLLDNSGGPGLVCGTGGPTAVEVDSPTLFGLVFADTGQYPGPADVPAALGDLEQLIAIPFDKAQPLFNVVVAQDGSPQVTATVAGCTSTITYRYTGSFSLPTDVRAGTYQVLPVGVSIPFLTSDGSAVTLPFSSGNLPVLEVVDPTLVTTVPSTVVLAPPTSVVPDTVPPTTVATASEGGGGGSTGLVAGGAAVVLVGLAGGAGVMRSRRPSRSKPDDHRPPNPDQPTVRAVADKGTQRVTSSNRGNVLGVRVVTRTPTTTTIRRTGEGNDNDTSRT